MRTHATRVLLLAVVLGVGPDAKAQRLAVVTTVLPGPGVSLTAAQDLLIDLDSGTIRTRTPAAIDGSYPNQHARLAVATTADGRYVVGAHMRIPVTVPITFPLAFRDTTTGVSGTVVEGVSKIVAAPDRVAVYATFWNGDIGLVDVRGVRRLGVCDSGFNPSAIAVSRDGDELYVACSTSLRVLDSTTGQERGRFTLAATPREMHVVAGGRLFTLDYAGPVVFAIMEMSVYDLATGTRLANAPTPIADRGLAWAVPSPDGTRVVVGVGSSTASFDATPHVVDSGSLAVLGVWPMDRVTKLAFTSAGEEAVVLREIPLGTFDTVLAAALVEVGSTRVLAQGSLGMASYPGMSNVVVLEPPLPPVLQPAVVSGSRVTLTWQMPGTSRLATDVIVEAGSTPTSFELLSHRLGSATTTFVAAGVPAGRYYVRVRALNATGVSRPSQTIEVHVP